ncbi:hypothetical protein [Parerythrobacter aestuarii]|uniref:hypothetical protein n=1 Tax=Parerythrobacter aestuarii TaxID=3020909 RepID=UPI0024DE166F|nr:hypothetical protein [Parerythrobacter aestuarii]
MSAVEDYLQANSDYEDAKSALFTLSRSLKEFADRLERYPEKTMFSNLSGDKGMPMEVSLSRETMSFDANAWPTPLQIHEAIRQRLEAKGRVETAWRAVPDALRKSLVPPQI